ncbi:Fe-S cluster assembly protein SufD [Phreatobacter aquaticus]|uniref:Fe-S cluster assembly protein SufD n=1 Tax=Phreatobacter aquaticus TaxID=2570229 RepID=A0A4D7QQW2_9HYPH|nr:Fe-S cluster assembly protein SufD [Phreatobacter aquaticus]QCK87634.1 Fe-S cluster assembly protein SufD [Phreatobacter aquaticus]
MNAVTPIRTPAEQALIGAFAATREQSSGALGELRERGFAQFEADGLPHRRVEEWKYTDLRASMREAKPLAGAPAAAELLAAKNKVDAMPRIGGARIVLVDGFYAPELSDGSRLPEGVAITPLAEALVLRPELAARLTGGKGTATNAAFALNGAFLTDGLVIDIAAGADVGHVLDLVSIVSSAAQFVTSRVLVLVGQGASAGLVETHVGPAGIDYQKNSVVQAFIGDGATFEHGRRQIEGDKAMHLATLEAVIGANAHFDTLTLTTGAALSRNQLFVSFSGEHAKATLRGVTMLRGKQHADTTLVMDHGVPHCDSRELFKHVLDDEAHGVFQGRINVAKEAQKTDGRMMSQTIMLKDGPSMDNKPELEIFADDVQCAHGCTCGELDEDLMFYLMARGIPRAETERLLVEAFAREAIEDFGDGPLAAVEELREAMLGTVGDWMRARG